MMYGSKNVGSKQNWENGRTHYKAVNIGESNWWHCEVYITSMAAYYVDFTDTATPNSAVDGIKFISRGKCVIDNVRISAEDSGLGNYNSLKYIPKVGQPLWIKTCWVGILRSVNIGDTEYVTYTPTDKSKFYVHCDAAGTTDVVTTIVCGYNRRTYTTTKTVTITS